jgi:DNA-directed RNA polymerase specialized sigma24 family protein
MPRPPRPEAPVSPPSNNTAELLAGCHRGDAAALATLLERNLAWVQAHVSRRLGPQLRQRGDSQDIVQETMIQVVRSGPRFVVADGASFRALVAKMVENTIRRIWRHEVAHRRDLRRDEEFPGDDTVLHLGESATRPSEAAARRTKVATSARQPASTPRRRRQRRRQRRRPNSADGWVRFLGDWPQVAPALVSRWCPRNDQTSIRSTS